MRIKRSLVLFAQISACAATIYAVSASEIAAAASAATARLVPADPLQTPELTLADMILLTRQEGTVIVDARAPEAFARGHLPHAVSLPLAAALTDPNTITTLPVGRNLVVYCDNTGCLTSHRLGRIIKERGNRSVAVYAGGWNEWNSLGLPHEP